MIERIAQLLHVSEWDWVAIIIALFSLGISIASMVYAKRTFKSQRQTEINTSPVIKPSIQEFLLREIFVKVFDGYMRLIVLKHIYDNVQYKSYVSEEKMTDLKIDANKIHVELFFSDEVKFRCIQGLYDLIYAFNNRIDVCVDHFKTINISTSLLENEISRLINKETNIIITWTKVMNIVYGYDDAQERRVLDNVVNRYDTIKDNEELDQILFDNNNIFSLFYDTQDQKEKITSFMNRYAAGVTTDFSSLLIDR